MRGSLVKRHKGSSSLVFTLGYVTDPNDREAEGRTEMDDLPRHETLKKPYGTARDVTRR